MPSWDFDDDDENNENNKPTNVNTEYTNPIDKTISHSDYVILKQNFNPMPLMRPHNIHQDFFEDKRYQITAITSVFLSNNKKRILKEIEISYDDGNKNSKLNLQKYMEKIMNEINMQNLAKKFEKICDIKVPEIFNYGVITESSESSESSVYDFIPLKRADSMELGKKKVKIFIEMEYIPNSVQLSKLIYKTEKEQCIQYKDKLMKIKKCFESHGFSHGDMKNLDNTLVMDDGKFAIIDYGESSIKIDKRGIFQGKIDNININCDLKGGSMNKKYKKTIKTGSMNKKYKKTIKTGSMNKKYKKTIKTRIKNTKKQSRPVQRRRRKQY